MNNPPTPFVPADLDCSDFARIQPFYEALQARELKTATDVERWLIDFALLGDTVGESSAKLNIDKACHTDDKEIETRYLHFIEHVAPKIKPYHFELQKKYLAAKRAHGIIDDRPEIALLDKHWRTDVDLFRPENIPLHTAEAKLVSEFDKISGAMTVTFQGKEMTLQQLAKFGEETDRPLRQTTWERVEKRRLADRLKLDDLFDQMHANRQRQAVNAGFADYRAFIWRAKHRFDYTPADCLAFAKAVEETATPLLNDLDRQRQAALKLDKLRPWDQAVDVKGRPPLKPFEQNDIAGFVERTRRAIGRISPDLAQRFARLNAPRSLDLDSRKGKRPGGFQSALRRSKYPFIFMNATGRQGDVETLLHEAGHAFHYQSVCDHMAFVRSAPLEFCEVASMSMELLTVDALDEFYPSKEDHARAKRMLLESKIRLFPWIATIDSFQHWVYTHPGHTQEQRAAAWLEVTGRLLSSVVDYSGYEESQRYQWQKQIHLFCYPFYYIEYGIAQLGALQVWHRFRKDPAAALDAYKHALSLGGKRALPDLFRAAGAKWDFSKATIEPLVTALREELAKLPA